MRRNVRPFSLLSASRSHLATVGESYLEHMRFAAAVGIMMAAAGLACILHAIVPALCKTTGSRTIARLHALIEDRDKLEETRSDTQDAAAFVLLLALSLAAAAFPWAAGARSIVALPLSLLAMGLPIAFLIVNPDLESMPNEPAPRA